MIEGNVRSKVEELIRRTAGVNVPVKLRHEEWFASCQTWLAEAVNVAELAVPHSTNAYRRHIDHVAVMGGDWIQRIITLSRMFQALLNDIDAGLLGSLRAGPGNLHRAISGISA
jgi:hypothetical protein